MIVVNYHDDLNEVQGDTAVVALLSAPLARAPFDRIEWFRNLVDNCDLVPLLAVARQRNACAVLPLMREEGHLASLANWYTFRCTPLATDDATRHNLLTALARDLAGRTHRVVLDKLDEQDATELAACFRKAGWLAWRTRSDTNRVHQLNGATFAQFIANRPGSLRTTLKRKAKRIDVSLHRTFDAAVWADYQAIYEASWKPQEGSPAFLRRFAQEEGAADRLRMAIGRYHGQAVAAQLWTVENGTAFIHKLAHREDAKALSPGTILSAALFEEVIDRDRVSLIDFGTGDDPYKRDWMDHQRLRYRLDMVRPAWPGNWSVIARHALRRMLCRG
ncbi:MAG: GNAT family N-acetyltransferase [Sphingomonadales bacterium]|nr:GNAT family N-acetyltransferase [Sphingomonadales bacterium]